MKTTLILAAAVLLFSCKKEAGEGGTSAIRGKVYAYEYNSLGTLLDSFYVADERVYIIYGDEDDIYDEDMRTNFDGSYFFEHLRKGKYRVFTYSECDSCPGGETAVFQEVEIKENNKIYELPDIVIRE